MHPHHPAHPPIRPATPADTDAIVDLAVDSTLFPPDATDVLRDILARFHAGTAYPEHELHLLLDPASARPLGVIFFGPDPMTDRKWDLWMIAVASAHQRRGLGSVLLAFTESRARAAGGRVLLIDTSSQPKFNPTRAFYARHGYTEVARVPDYYTDGDAKVTYSKRLAPAPAAG